jgi:hypothetical protein
MKYAVWLLVAALIVLHQDYWQWNDAALAFGFLPRTLLYHSGISLAAAVVWLLAVRHCWPDVESVAGEGDCRVERPRDREAGCRARTPE